MDFDRPFKFFAIHFKRGFLLYTESVRESGEMSYISAQSRKSSFQKIQISDVHILHFRRFIPCLGLKIIATSSCIYVWIFENGVKELDPKP